MNFMSLLNKVESSYYMFCDQDDIWKPDKIEVTYRAMKSAEEKEEEGKTFSRDCLLNYHIGPSEQVVIQSETLSGTYIVIKGKHTGSPKGKWLTTMELKPA
mgnify:FL=1